MMALLGQIWSFKYSKRCFSRLQVLQTAALAFGGGPPPALRGATEEYDGTTWTTPTPNLNTARQF
jgi:hypothetical protein